MKRIRNPFLGWLAPEFFSVFCKKEGLRDDNREDIISKAEALSNLRY